jgi:hypothetical protein
MHHIIYISQAKEAMTLTTLVVLLMQARSLNEQQQVTGALVYGDGQFMQLMEGEESVIKDLYERVAKDPRHHDVRKLAEGAIASRSFAQWSMAFGEVPAQEFQVLRSIAAYQTPEQMASQLDDSSAAGGLLLEKMKELVQMRAQS